MNQIMGLRASETPTRAALVCAFGLSTALAVGGCGSSSSPVSGDAGATPPVVLAPEASCPDQAGGLTVVRSAAGRVEIESSPLRLKFFDGDGQEVLANAAQSAIPVLPRAPVPDRVPGGSTTASSIPLYAPFTFVVGQTVQTQYPSGFFVANMLASAVAGVEHRLEDVQGCAVGVDDTGADAVADLTVSTSDPSGRLARVVVKPDEQGTFNVRVTLDPVDDQIALMTAAFDSVPGEAFRGFGGRRNKLDQRGERFLNWAEAFSQTPEEAEEASDSFNGRERHAQFPTGPQGAYYVQSLFISSRDYGFMLDRDELSQWRMASDREDAWMVEVAGSELDFLVAPGDSPTAIGKLSAINGRHRLPPLWALGPMVSEAVQISTDSPASYSAKVLETLDMVEHYDLPLSAISIESWVGLEKAGVYQQVLDRMAARDIKPVIYFKGYVDSQSGDLKTYEREDEYQEALDNGYVATNAVGEPFLFGSPLHNDKTAAMIDFTKPEAIAWWKDRIKEGLDTGAEGFMQDFGEQTFVDMVFANGRTGIAMHNRVAIDYHKATREAFDEYVAENPGREPWFFVRFGYSGRPGSAHYEGASWNGDTTADWSRASGIGSVIPDMLNRGIGGSYGYTTDIGGYIDTTGRPELDLVIRGGHLASLLPVNRLHGGPVNGTHMPWRYGATEAERDEAVARYRKSIDRNIAARPLIFALWQEAFETGIPINRPLWLIYPDHPEAAAQDQMFMLGPDVLVAPVVTQGATSREVWFPPGCWRHPEAGDTHTGPTTKTVDAPIDFLPYYFRCDTQPFPVPEGGF